MKATPYSSDRDSQGTAGSDMTMLRKDAADLSATGSEEALNCSSDRRSGPGPYPEQEQDLAQARTIPAPVLPPAQHQGGKANTNTGCTPPRPAAASRSAPKPAIADETLSTASDVAAAAHQRQQQRDREQQHRRSHQTSAASRPHRSRHYHLHQTSPHQPPASYVPYGYQEHRAASPYGHDDYYDGYGVRGPPPCSRRWDGIKRALTLLSMAWAAVILSLACLFAAQGGVADSVGVWSIPIAIAALVWNSAELFVYAARARGVAPVAPTSRGPAVAGSLGVRRGIHPGAHVGVHLCFWLACALAIYLTMMVYQDVQNTMADCAAAAAAAAVPGGPEDHCQAAYHYTSNLHLFSQGFYSPSLRALLAMFGLATLTHFALFVRACVEVDRRNRARFAAADDGQVDDDGAGVTVYGMVEAGRPWTWVQPPDYYREAGGPLGRQTAGPPAGDTYITTMYDEGGGGAGPGGRAAKERV